jgi:hypothetical protein
VSGIRVRETIPDEVLGRADEIFLVDLTPEALLDRLRGGKVYKPERIDAALHNFFRIENLSALREVALRQGTCRSTRHSRPSAIRPYRCSKRSSSGPLARESPSHSRVARGRTYRDALRRLLEEEQVDRVIVSATDSPRIGLSAEDLEWLLQRVPAEVMILRPAPDDTRRISANGADGHL